MHFLSLAALWGLALCVAGHLVIVNPSPPNQTLPQGWQWIGPAAGDTPLQLSIGLSQPRLAELATHVRQKRLALSRAPLEQYQKPQARAADGVLSWLDQNNITGEPDGSWIRFNTTVGHAQALLNADVSYYAYKEQQPVLRAPSYALPNNLSQSVEIVYPLNHFLASSSGRSSKKTAFRDRRKRQLAHHHNRQTGSCPDVMTPACLRQLYNWPTSFDLATSQVRFGVAGFLDQFANWDDLDEFVDVFAPHAAGYNASVALVGEGAHNPQQPRYGAGSEASLDMQYALTLAHPAHVVYYSTGGRGVRLDQDGQAVSQSDNEPYLTLLEWLLALPDDQIPHVLSISYSDDEESVPRDYAQRVCSLFLQLSARGTSVLVASGDGGSRGIGHRRYCATHDGSGRAVLPCTFPASCPWVTAVGATDNTDLQRGASYSSGGFSTYFAQPEWQTQAVKKYSENQTASKSRLFPAHGRAVPDLAAVGSQFQVRSGGAWIRMTGTSASTPLVAAMVARANGARLERGKKPLGWLNRILYSQSTGLEDVSSGESHGCRFFNGQEEAGWTAAIGWDAVTGLGQPRDAQQFIQKLIDIA